MNANHTSSLSQGLKYDVTIQPWETKSKFHMGAC